MVAERVFLYEQAYGVGGFGLEPAAAYVQHLVEEAAHMETEAQLLLCRHAFGVLVGEYPSLVRSRELELVAVELGLVGGEDGTYRGQLQVAYA